LRGTPDDARRRTCVAPPDGDDAAADRGGVDDLDGRQRSRLELLGHGRVGQERNAEALADHLFRRVDVVELHDATGNDARLAEERARQVVVARRSVEQDQLLLTHLLDADLSRRGEAVAGVRDEDELVLVERHALDIRVA
jgi:hypothetical protein